MTELEKMQRAKMYIDKLANGINPIDDTVATENDVINNVRVSRCFFFISDILRQVIENGGTVNNAKNAQKSHFYLTDEQRIQYVPSDKLLSISEITKALNNIADLDKCKKLSYRSITDWLVNIGALEIYNDFNGKAKKHPTEQGKELGMSTETRVGMNGKYHIVVYNKEAQQFIVDNIDAITSLKHKNASKVAENQWQPWTQSQEECLIELFNKNVPVSEIAVTLMRTETGIRARLKKLGLIENRSDI